MQSQDNTEFPFEEEAPTSEANNDPLYESERERKPAFLFAQISRATPTFRPNNTGRLYNYIKALEDDANRQIENANRQLERVHELKDHLRQLFMQQTQRTPMPRRTNRNHYRPHPYERSYAQPAVPIDHCVKTGQNSLSSGFHQQTDFFNFTENDENFPANL